MTALVALSLLHTASACICVGHPDALFDAADVVVVGTVTSVRNAIQNSPQEFWRDVDVLVSEAFKGSQAGLTVRFSISSNSSCSIAPEPGETWIVYVSDRQTSQCTGSEPVDLDQVGPPPPPQRMTVSEWKGPPQEPYRWVPADLKALYALRERLTPR